MKMRWMKFAVLLLCLTMIVGAAHGENATTVMLLFQGLTAGGDGSWQITPLEGTFEVRRDGEWLGQLSTTDGQTVLTVAPGTDITLIPVRETMPEGFAVDEAYTVAVKEGITNVAYVMAYADTGIFRISGKAGNAYTLQNLTGEKVMECTLGADGMFAPEAAVPAGRYFLRSEESDRVAAVFTVQAYRGSADQIAQVQEQQDRVMLLGAQGVACARGQCGMRNTGSVAGRLACAGRRRRECDPCCFARLRSDVKCCGTAACGEHNLRYGCYMVSYGCAAV